jgi:hypothetical protein
LGTYYYNIQLGGNQKLRGQKGKRHFLTICVRRLLC